MSKRHIVSAVIALTAWSATYVPFYSLSTGVSTTGLSNLQVGSVAQASMRWKPNPDRGSASSTLSGGRRGITASACGINSDVPDPALTLLVPAGDSAELTAQAQPTLSWFLESKTMTQMEFVLFHPTEAEPLYAKEISAPEGLVEVTLPESIELTEGTRYRWAVFMTCNGGENEVHARSFVERVSADAVPVMPSSLSLVEQAHFYASHGVWYDALNTLVRAYREDAQMNTLLNIRDLLEQAGTEVPLDLSLATAAS